MAKQTSDRDLSPVIGAARTWIDRCLILDQSVFSATRLWTPELIEEVREAFVDHPDAGEGDFFAKLKKQMAPASVQAKQLMAEMVWALFLFPSNVKPGTKRRRVIEVWNWSGERAPDTASGLSDDQLSGIGSGGQGFNTNRWRELVFLISLSQSLKRGTDADRRRVIYDYDEFIKWIDTVPQKGDRQFRHMLRFFCFPDRVERMCSNGDRRSILEAFGIAPQTKSRHWNDRTLDDALLDLRKRLENEHPHQTLDFYNPPLNARWEREGDGPEDDPSGDEIENKTEPKSAPESPVNRILYGPPGTGKTYWIREKAKNDYTDVPSAADRETWLQSTLAKYGWRAVIIAALADLGRPVRVTELRSHAWIVEKDRQRTSALATLSNRLWANLQTHTPESVATVNYGTRRPPFVFSKRQTGEWELLPEWQEQDEEGVELLSTLRKGPAAAVEPIRRFRIVTFHPSYSYEDFVRGIRPVATSDEGDTQFRLVDGVFKRICDEARANPGKRYALFIDEINRANIAKVFGELIALIEMDKRVTFDSEGRITTGMAVQLAGGDGSGGIEPPFGVPTNLDIYGTMNTADRSIALLDIALRRRFEFEELEPRYALLNRSVGTVHLGQLLKRINDRLEFMLDRDHRIGHAYLMEVRSIEQLRHGFGTQIIPLLQEFFFDDLSKVATVLATGSGTSVFMKRDTMDYGELFGQGRHPSVSATRSRFSVTPEQLWTEESFRALYASIDAVDDTEAVTVNQP